MDDRPPIPDDLAPRWEWHPSTGSGQHGAALRRIGEPLYIAWPAPRVFDEARACDRERERLRAARKPEQTRMEL